LAIGLAILMLAGCTAVLGYPEAVKALARLSQVEGEIGRQISENAALARDYRGYIWSQWFRQSMRQLWALFAVLLGAGGLLAQASRGGALFMLALPVSRRRLLGVRAAAALAELLILALIPALLIPLLSPAIGQSYSFADAIVHGTCMFIAGSVLFSITFLLSTVFSDVWRPPLIALCLAVVARLLERFFGGEHLSLLAVMTAESYFRGGGVPWQGLLVSAAVSAALLYAATRTIARQDF
jgi:ABC-type transport system involved in multi-copper enzyme maturation permease subunit